MGWARVSLDPKPVIPRRIVAAITGASMLFLQGCGAEWHRTDIVTPESPRQQVEVWQGNASQQWHAVRVTDSAVSGISFLKPIECDSCRVTVPRATVDSIRLGNPSLGLWKTLGLILMVPSMLLWGACAVSGSTCSLGGS